jgi:ATP-dependent DNA helicase Q4
MKRGASIQRKPKASNPFMVSKRHNLPAPPTETTLMLESLLEGKKPRKKKPSKVVARPENPKKQAPRKQQLATAPSTVFEAGSLADAKTFLPMKAMRKSKPKKRASTALLNPKRLAIKVNSARRVTLDAAFDVKRFTEPPDVDNRVQNSKPAVVPPQVEASSLNIQEGSSDKSKNDSANNARRVTLDVEQKVDRFDEPPAFEKIVPTMPTHTIPPPSTALALSIQGGAKKRTINAGLSVKNPPPKRQQLDPTASKVEVVVEKATAESREMQQQEQLQKQIIESRKTVSTKPVVMPEMGAPRYKAPLKSTKAVAAAKKAGNDNFVRQNLKNAGGSCRGGGKKKNDKWGKRGKYDASKYKGKSKHPRKAAIDPMDDYLDGNYHAKKEDKDKQVKDVAAAPCCSGHQRPCKKLVVKKSGGNKGRKFYVCSLPRGEQCDFFEWAENSAEAAKQALLKKSSHSGFVARQVSSYVERFRELTVPELRQEAKLRDLNSLGKKRELLMRLSLFVRDELANSGIDGGGGEEEEEVKDADIIEQVANDELSASSEELEIGGAGEEDEAGISLESDGESDSDSVDHGDSKEVDVLPTNIPVASKDLTIHDHLYQLFGHSEFRDGQGWAVERCMTQKRSLLVAPTGFGKSLCYALPAAILTGTCIVVSPLISLIEDQLRQLPPKIPAATLSGGMSAAALACTIDDVIKGRIKILYVSPERLATPSFRRLFKPRWNEETQTRERRFPPVSLLCIDEAHCISQWGHNFRPSYLRIRSLLNSIEPQSVLAVTATAGPPIVRDICRYLQIPDGTDGATESEIGVKILKSDRDNIDVFCKIMDNDESRVSLVQRLLLKPLRKPTALDLKEPIFDGCLAKSNVIVYVWRQRDAEVVAEALSATGLDGGVVVYHGGMDSKARSRAQSRFLRGKARVCVATVAFGMGVNKIDIDAVVHMNLPSSLEHYMQEIGRAGRDGRASRAISLPVTDEVTLRHSLSHSNLISESQVVALLRMLDASLKEVCDDNELTPSGSDHRRVFIGVPVDTSATALDCKIETVETLLSLMEADEVCSTFLSFEGRVNDIVTVVLKRSPLQQLEAREQVARCILKCGRKIPQVHQSEANDGDGMSYKVARVTSRSCGVESYEFSVSRCTNLMGQMAEPRHVYAALRRLQSMGEIELVFDSKGYALQLQIDLAGFAHGDLGKNLWNRFSNQIKTMASKVKNIDWILREIADVDDDKESEGEKSTRLLKFQELATKELSEGKDDEEDPREESLPKVSQELIYDARSAVHHIKDAIQQADNPDYGANAVQFDHSDFMDYTALAVAKFLHGLESGRTASFAKQHPLYGKWRHIDFETMRTHLLNSLKGND